MTQVRAFILFLFFYRKIKNKNKMKGVGGNRKTKNKNKMKGVGGVEQ